MPKQECIIYQNSSNEETEKFLHRRLKEGYYKVSVQRENGEWLIMMFLSKDASRAERNHPVDTEPFA